MNAQRRSSDSLPEFDLTIDPSIFDGIEIAGDLVPSSHPEPRKPAFMREAPTAEMARAVAPLAACPKCGAYHQAKAEECAACGIVFAKFRPDASELEAIIPPHLINGVMRAWDKVVESYADESLHEAFIARCYEAHSLAYASQKYARILAETPNEKIAIEMRKRIIDIAGNPVEMSDIEPEQRRAPKMIGMILFLAAAVTTMGLMVPYGRGLVGFGLSLIATMYYLRKFLRPVA